MFTLARFWNKLSQLLLPGTKQYWCHKRNHGRDTCGVQTHNPKVVRQTPYPLGQRSPCVENHYKLKWTITTLSSSVVFIFLLWGKRSYVTYRPYWTGINLRYHRHIHFYQWMIVSQSCILIISLFGSWWTFKFLYQIPFVGHQRIFIQYILFNTVYSVSVCFKHSVMFYANKLLWTWFLVVIQKTPLSDLRVASARKL